MAFENFNFSYCGTELTITKNLIQLENNLILKTHKEVSVEIAETIQCDCSFTKILKEEILETVSKNVSSLQERPYICHKTESQNLNCDESLNFVDNILRN